MNTRKIEITYQELSIMFKDGLTTAEMARKLFTSEATVRRRLHEFNLIRDLSVYDKSMYIRMKKLGMNDDDIAYIFGSSKKSLQRWKWRAGLTKKYKQTASDSSKDVISNVEDDNIERRN